MKRAERVILSSSHPLSWLGSLLSPSAARKRFLAGLPSEVYELCRYGVEEFCTEAHSRSVLQQQQQQPPQHPPSFTPSPRLKFVLPHMQGSLDLPLLSALVQCKTKGRLCFSSKAFYHVINKITYLLNQQIPIYTSNV